MFYVIFLLLKKGNLTTLPGQKKEEKNTTLNPDFICSGYSKLHPFYNSNVDVEKNFKD